MMSIEQEACTWDVSLANLIYGDGEEEEYVSLQPEFL